MNKRGVLFLALLVLVVLVIFLAVRNSHNIRREARREARREYWDLKKQIRRFRDSTEIKTLS
jgi:putative copper export protein